MNSFIHKDFIFPNSTASTFREAIEIIGERMFEKDFVRATYIDAVLDREINFPTGLETAAGGIAIPHTDKQHVLKSAIGVMTLEEPIKVHSMIDPKEEVEVQLLFLLAVSDPEGQLETLKKLMGLLQDKNFKASLDEADDVEKIYNILVEKEL